MNSKRKTMLVAAFVVAVVALAGVGYATAVQYKATTVNSGNDTTNSYILAEQETYTGLFGGNVDMWTYTEDGTTVYSLKDSAAVDSLFGVSLGTTTISIEAATIEPTTYVITASTNMALPDGWSYVLKYQGSGNAVYSTGVIGNDKVTWSDSSAVTPSNGTIAVTLYIAGPAFSTLGTTITPDGYGSLGSSDSYTGSASLYTDMAIAFTLTTSIGS